jgi:soluble lytic murein transglycosylase-like protein
MWVVRLLIACLLLVPVISGAFCFDEAGKTYGISSQLLQSIARIESNLNPNAINKNSNGSTDIGIMQVNSSWIASLGLDSGRLVSDPCYNVMTGARILKYCIDKHGYTWEAVGCYNAVSRHKRVDYSWKVYNKLKAEGIAKSKEQRAKSKEQRANPVLPTHNSSLFFSVRDNAAIE